MGLPALLCFSVLHLKVHLIHSLCAPDEEILMTILSVEAQYFVMASILCHSQIFHLVVFRSTLLLRNLWIVVIMWLWVGRIILFEITHKSSILCPLIEGLNEIQESQYTCPRGHLWGWKFVEYHSLCGVNPKIQMMKCFVYSSTIENVKCFGFVSKPYYILLKTLYSIASLSFICSDPNQELHSSKLWK